MRKIHLLVKLFILQALLLSCLNRNDYKYRLADGGKNYWDEFDEQQHKVIGGYCFDKSAACFYYTYNKTGVRFKAYDGDVVYPHTWLIKGDSLINILGFDRRIMKFTNDSLELQNIVTKQLIILLKAK